MILCLALCFAHDHHKLLLLYPENCPQYVREIHNRRFTRAAECHYYGKLLLVFGKRKHLLMEEAELVFDVMAQEDREEPFVTLSCNSTSHRGVSQKCFQN